MSKIGECVCSDQFNRAFKPDLTSFYGFPKRRHSSVYKCRYVFKADRRVDL